MAKTKGGVVRSALSLLGLAGFEFDIIPEELAAGVDFLNTMLSVWSTKGLKIPFNYAGHAEDSSGLPDSTLEAIYANLAIRLAPTYGKQVSLEVRQIAKHGLNTLYGESAKPRTRQFDWLPAGAGNKGERFIVPEDRYPWIVDGLSDFSGGELDFFVDDVGVLISIDFFGAVDLSEATAITIRYRKPDGTEGTWTGTAETSFAQYTTVEGDIDQAGVWFLQAFAEFATGVVVSSNVESRTVGEGVQGEDDEE